MSQIKELDSNEKLVTTLAVIAGLIIFALTLFKCQGGADFLGLNQEPAEVASESVVTDLSDDNSALEDQMLANIDKYDKLAEEHELLKEELEALTAQNSELESDASSYKRSSIAAPAAAAAAVGTVSLTDHNVLQGKLEKLQEKYDALKNAGSTSGDDPRYKELQTRYDKLTLAKDEVTKKKDKVIADLEAQLAGKGDSAGLKKKLKQADATWKKQIDKLKVNHDQEIARLRNDHKKELNEFRSIVRGAKAKKVFANSADDLAPAAKRLISTLEGYKGTKPAELNKLYGQIDKQQSAVRKLVVNFDSGSSAVRADDQAKIKELIEKAGENSYFVAVGYADTTGTASKNKVLSSKRATNVATVIKPQLGDTQFTQAYYLGQTTRFGADENNRVVEIWEIAE